MDALIFIICLLIAWYCIWWVFDKMGWMKEDKDLYNEMRNKKIKDKE